MARLLEFLSDLPFGFGGASVSGEGKGYGFGKITEDDSIGLLKSAFDRGVRLYDTAPIYGFGTSEVRIGKAFHQKREEVFIISKSGVSWHEDSLRVNMTNDPQETQKMIEASLRRLDSDYIDLYMIHWPDENVDIRIPMEILAKAKDQGKIKHIGLCNTFKDDLIKAQEIESIDAVQSQLNIFDTNVVTELFDYLKSHEISFMSWGTLDKGIISGTVTKDRKFESEDCRSWAPWWKKSEYLKKVEAMQRVFPHLDKDGFSGIDLAVSHNLSYDIVDCVLVGARNEKQLNGVLESFQKKISDEKLSEYLGIINEENK